jgi:hypothetical protein
MTTMHTNPTAGHARPRTQAGPAARRFGYLVAIAVNAAMLYLVNRSPGWEALPFLTPSTVEVIGIVNASIVASIVANVVYLVWDADWVRALGDVATTSIGLAALVQIWQVWPVEFDAGTPWDTVARWVIGIGIIGSAIGIIAALVRLGRSLSASPSWPDDPSPGTWTRHHA